MRIGLLFLSLGITGLYGAEWIPNPSALIDTNMTVAEVSVSGAYDSQNQQLFAGWRDLNKYFHYATYTPTGGWVNYPLINVTANEEYVLGYDAATNEVLAAYGDYSNNSYPTVIKYSAGSWSSPQVISTGSSVFNDVSLCYDSANQVMFAAWVDTSQTPYYSIYSGGSWIDTNPISNISGAESNVSLAFDSTTGTIFAAWTDASTNYPTYSIYQSGAWTNPQPIVATPSSSVDVSLVYDAAINGVFAGWMVPFSSIYIPNFSIYQNGVWGSSLSIPGAPLSGNDVVVALGYDSIDGQVFAAWTSSGVNKMNTYAIYDPAAEWSYGDIGGGSPYPVYNNNLVYVNDWNTMFALFSDTDNFNPHWSSYTQPFPVDPVRNLTGQKIINDFGAESEIFVHLTWFSSPTQYIEGYHIYENGVLIATVSPSTLQYAIHNLSSNAIYTFSVTAFSSDAESIPVTIIIRS